MNTARVIGIDLPRCTAQVSHATQGYSGRTHGDGDDQCRAPAKYKINDRPLCARHGGTYAISVLLEQNEKEEASADLLLALKKIIEFEDGGASIHPGALVLQEARLAITKAEENS